MEIINEEMNPEIEKINEMYFKMTSDLSPRITNSVYYVKLKYLLFDEIVKFCKEKLDLRSDLLNIRTHIGDNATEEEIRNIFSELKNKYNSQSDQTICLDYHIESTHLDYGVCLFAIIRRGDIIYVKKFIFRFRKGSAAIGLDFNGITNGGTLEPRKDDPKYVKEDILDLLGGKRNV